MKLFRSAPGSSLRLLQYAFFYFFFYVLYGLGVKFYQAPASLGFPGISDLEFLVFSTYGSALVCLGVVILGKWWKCQISRQQLVLIVFSGICTALVIPTTTLLYSLPVSVMVAMVIMRGSVIVISRLVDALMLAQKLSNKQVHWEENVAVLIALSAVGLNLFFSHRFDFNFVHAPLAVVILTVYVISYALRIYLMNFYKFTIAPEHHVDNKNFFAIEQLTAAFLIFGSSLFVVCFPRVFSVLPESPRGAVEYFYSVLVNVHPKWLQIAVAGMPFGFSAFFSLFLFLFAGRTATFAGLANRLTSLLAGTASTLLFALIFGGKWPSGLDWASYVLILVSVGFLARAERKRR